MNNKSWKEIAEEFETIMHFECDAVVRLNQTQIVTLMMLLDEAKQGCSEWEKHEFKVIGDKLGKAYDEADAEHKKAVEHFKLYHPLATD